MTDKARLLELLSDGKPHSHKEAYRLGLMAHSRAADLRADGHDIRVWREGKLYMYQLVTLHETPALAPGSVSHGAPFTSSLQDGAPAGPATSPLPAEEGTPAAERPLSQQHDALSEAGDFPRGHRDDRSSRAGSEASAASLHIPASESAQLCMLTPEEDKPHMYRREGRAA